MPQFCIFVLFVGHLIGLNSPKPREVVSSVPKHRKAVVCLRENICVLEKLRPSMSDRAVG